VFGGTDDVDLAGGEGDKAQVIDPFEQHGVDREEVTGQHRVRLGGEELFPGGPVRRGAGSTPAWCRIFQTVLAAIW
jgi:hypothetical protein